MADYYGFSYEARSVSDGETEGERRLRRSRRKRGGPRYRPYDLSPEYDTDDVKAKNSPRIDLRDRYGMAPPNSTQFLLDDREARADAEYEIEQNFEAAERRRIRSMSGGCEVRSSNNPFWITIEPATTTACGSSDQDSVSGESEADREMEREFETDYLAVKRERIQSMTKSQLAAELLERDYDTQVLTQELGTKDAENRHLRQLLSAHGITLEDARVSSTTPTLESNSPEVTAN